MTNREIAPGFIRNFCKGDISGLEKLLAPDLSFRGAFHAFSLASEYIASLKSDPPEKCQCKILSVTENKDSVALFYEYSKPTGVQHIAQLFKYLVNKSKKYY